MPDLIVAVLTFLIVGALFVGGVVMIALIIRETLKQ